MPKALTENEIAENPQKEPGWTRRDRRFRVSIPSPVHHGHGVCEPRGDSCGVDGSSPDIVIQYKKVKLTLSTHSAGGLTDLDFTLARKIDA